MHENLKHVEQLTIDELVLMVNKKQLNAEKYKNDEQSSHLDIIRQIIRDGGDTQLLTDFEIISQRYSNRQQNSHMRNTIPVEYFNADKWLYERKNGYGTWEQELKRRKQIKAEYVQAIEKINEDKHKQEEIQNHIVAKMDITRNAVESLITIQKEKQDALVAIQMAGYTIVNEDDIVDYVQPNLRKIRKILDEQGFHVIQDNLIDPYGQNVIPENEKMLGTDSEIGPKQGDKSVHQGIDQKYFLQTLDQKKIDIEDSYYEKLLKPLGSLSKSGQVGNVIEYFKERDQLVEEWHEERESMVMLASSVKYKQIEQAFSLNNQSLNSILQSVPEENYMTVDEQNDKHAKFRLENLHSTSVDHMSKNRHETDQLDLPFEFDFSSLNFAETSKQVQSIEHPNPLTEVIQINEHLQNKPGVKPGYNLEQIEEGARYAQRQIEVFFQSKNMRHLQNVLEAYQALEKNPDLYLSPQLKKRFLIVKNQLANFRTQYNGIYKKAVALIRGGAEVLEQISVKGVKQTFKDNFQTVLDVMQDEAHGNSQSRAFFQLVDDFYKSGAGDKLKKVALDIHQQVSMVSEKNMDLEPGDRAQKTEKKKSLWNQFKDFIQSDAVQTVASLFEEHYPKIKMLVNVTTGFNLDNLKVAYDYGKQIYNYADKVFDENYGLISLFNDKDKQQHDENKKNEKIVKENLNPIDPTKSSAPMKIKT